MHVYYPTSPIRYRASKRTEPPFYVWWPHSKRTRKAARLSSRVHNYKIQALDGYCETEYAIQKGPYLFPIRMPTSNLRVYFFKIKHKPHVFNLSAMRAKKNILLFCEVLGPMNNLSEACELHDLSDRSDCFAKSDD